MSSGNEPNADYPASGATLDGQAAAANLLGIRSAEQLRRREYRETSLRALEIVTGRVEIARTGDFLEWSAIHAHLFGRIYEWAGMPRAVTMSKDGRPFLQPRHFADYIPLTTDYIRSVDWSRLEREQFVTHAARALMQLNWCHPFREGNGRAMRLFFDRQITAAPWQLNYTDLEPPPPLERRCSSVPARQRPNAHQLSHPGPRHRRDHPRPPPQRPHPPRARPRRL
ncbi:Fic family protein [Nocardia beijingensis]|uniref:Fic/DOC family protein n=1 Tax=Nocardia beijingensis TaxID=95162 RepID=UPI00344D1B00